MTSKTPKTTGLTSDDVKAIISSVTEALNPRTRRPPWREIARPEQLRPPDCVHWLYLAGRGSGKTRAAAERIRERVESGEARFIALIGATFADVRDVMVEGESGLKAVAGHLFRKYNRSIGEIMFRGGAKARFFSGEDPESLRGWQSTDVWGDELCAWRLGQSTFDMAMFGLRLGSPEAIWTTTPKNQEVLKGLIQHPACKVTRSTTHANRANLAPAFFDSIVRKYEKTRLGRQELDGEILEEAEGALWKRDWFEVPGFRMPKALAQINGRLAFEPPPQVQRVVVALDPSVGDADDRRDTLRQQDACGLIVAGVDASGHAYVLADYTSVMAPTEWARKAVALFDFCGADVIVAESNQGGTLIREMIQTLSSNTPVHLVHASVGKRPRAMPVASLYEQGRVHHCGEFRDLEDQMVAWDADDLTAKSPNNVDALVWAFHALGLSQATGIRTHDRINRR